MSAQNPSKSKATDKVLFLILQSVLLLVISVGFVAVSGYTPALVGKILLVDACLFLSSFSFWWASQQLEHLAYYYLFIFVGVASLCNLILLLISRFVFTPALVGKMLLADACLFLSGFSFLLAPQQLDTLGMASGNREPNYVAYYLSMFAGVASLCNLILIFSNQLLAAFLITIGLLLFCIYLLILRL